jgi:RNA polymerase sigma-70 factor (ECF subfamily)
LVQQLRQHTPGSGEVNDQSPIDDSALARAVLKNDRKASAEFVARFADGIYSYIRSRLAPRYDHVEDLVQETFLAAWQNLGRYESSGPLQSWIMAIARHKVEDYYRARLRAQNPLEEEDQDGSILASPPKIHEFLEQEQLRLRTQQVLASLPEPYRLALIWRYWDKASAREMAIKTGKTEKAIERLLARARAEFRERWSGGKSA